MPLSNIVDISITRTSRPIEQASFDTPAILAEFATNKTTTAFNRHRFYADLDAATADGWTVYDDVYKQLQLFFSQNPRIPQVMVGRKDSTDASWADALAAIKLANNSWYSCVVAAAKQTKVVFKSDLITGNSIVFTINGTVLSAVPFNTNHSTTMTDIKTAIEAGITGSAVTVETYDPNGRTLSIKVKGTACSVSVAITGGASQTASAITKSTTKLVFSADFVASNSIVFTVNGSALSAVPFNTNQATTMADIKTAIEAGVSNSVVTIDNTDANTRTLLIDVHQDVVSVAVAITGGASQPTMVQTSNLTDIYKDVAAWVEANKKLFSMASSMLGMTESSTTDIGSELIALDYDRTIPTYKSDSQGDQTPSMIEAGWLGECMPYDPGSQTWAFKTIAGVSADSLTDDQINNLITKGINFYESIGGVSMTQGGKVASGEYIDVIRGLDWLESEIMTAVFTTMISVRKVPFTDDGIQLIVNAILGALKAGATAGVITRESIVVTAPNVSDVSSIDKQARLLPDITFSATLQGAIHKTEIAGTVSV